MHGGCPFICSNKQQDLPFDTGRVSTEGRRRVTLRRTSTAAHVRAKRSRTARAATVGTPILRVDARTSNLDAARAMLRGDEQTVPLGGHDRRRIVRGQEHEGRASGYSHGRGAGIATVEEPEWIWADCEQSSKYIDGRRQEGRILARNIRVRRRARAAAWQRRAAICAVQYLIHTYRDGTRPARGLGQGSARQAQTRGTKLGLRSVTWFERRGGRRGTRETGDHDSWMRDGCDQATPPCVLYSYSSPGPRAGAGSGTN